jgi:soluble lytic murein transglycosylase-like protein
VRRAIVRAALISVVLTGTAQAAKRQQPSRRVELISMTASPTVDREAVAAPTSDVGVDAALPAEFAAHDLSRRYVEFRMKRELAGTVEAAPVSQVSFAAVPTSSSIVVPGWMRADIQAVAAPAFVPGCAPQAYRPSGFLSREAEGRRAVYYGMMSSIACEHGIPTGLFDAMIIRESRYNPLALSPKNAFGFAQLMPGTAAGLGVDRLNPYQNMRGGALYLRQQLDKFGRVQLALAAYNAGPGRVRDGLVPQIAETQAYVTDIIANWTRLIGDRLLPPDSSTPSRFSKRKAHVYRF